MLKIYLDHSYLDVPGNLFLAEADHSVNGGQKFSTQNALPQARTNRSTSSSNEFILEFMRLRLHYNPAKFR